MSKARTILKMYIEGVSKQSISLHTGASRNTAKKYIRQFIAMGKALEEINKLSDNELEAVFSTPRQEAPSGHRKTDLMAFFPGMEKALKRKGETREKLWDQLFISINGSENIKNSLWHLFREIKKINPCIINSIKIRQRVITYWLWTINLRQVHGRSQICKFNREVPEG